jgi:hypothetical protein
MDGMRQMCLIESGGVQIEVCGPGGISWRVMRKLSLSFLTLYS